MLLDEISMITEIEELWDTIEWLNYQLEQKQPLHQKPNFSHFLYWKTLYGPLREEVIDILKHRDFIHAIKHVRQALNVGLKDAKDMVDEVRTQTGYGNRYWSVGQQKWIYPDNQQPKGKQMILNEIEEQTVIEILKQHGVILAIKHVRETLRVSLMEAKNMVNEICIKTGYGNEYWSTEKQPEK